MKYSRESFSRQMRARFQIVLDELNNEIENSSLQDEQENDILENCFPAIHREVRKSGSSDIVYDNVTAWKTD